MKKQDLQSLINECLAEVLAEGYSEFQRVDKGSKGVAAKDKAEKDTYGAGYAAGEKAAKAKYKKLAEAYKQLKEAKVLKEDDTKNPKDKYVVKPCAKKGEPWAVWEGSKRVKGFATKEQAKAFAAKQNKEQGLK